ncbi:tetratricopeptide repeat protein [Sphingomonas baiyangensis]|uniref:Tetratricopeptide repeat protein n=1 Tax=Sphingomonas baiyangensis TaxID=2572576 RepID=A0A4U1L795_9SPHN|nr:tetratricopeptide repeat protein [Sphingomonas baiyangensis]
MATAASDPPTGAALAAYVRARAADADGASDVAARGYAAALAADPRNEVIAIRAFREAMAIGDLALADRALSVLEASDVAPADTALFRFAQAVAAKDMAAATRAADAVAAGPLDFAAPVLRAWLAYTTREGDPAAILLASEIGAITRRYAAENRALIQIAQKRPREAVDTLQALLGNDQASLDLRINAAQLFASTGQPRLARALLEGGDPVLRAQAAALDRSARPGLAFGTSRLFTRLAADIGSEDTAPLTILLARSALLVNPADDRARLLLADALSHEGGAARAIALLDAIRPDSPFAGVARSARVEVLARQGDDAGALAAAQRLAEAEGAGVPALQSYGDRLVDDGRFADAAAAYAAAMAQAGDGDWVLNLQRGGALEQAGRWDEALPFLERAVELAPQEPVALNYLGYAQVERGLNLTEARGLLERARAMRPDDPAITDSLGWAYVQSGELAKGLPLLEQAAQAEPASVAINEHLGDAYWQAGRRFEARYAWRAAAIYAEDVDQRRIAAKLEGGPTAAPRTTAR